MTEEARQDKNHVFASPEPRPVHPQPPKMNDVGFDVPVELAPLPSQGKLYGADHPFHQTDAVEITAMTAKDEDILTSAAFIKKGTIVTELIRSCVVNKQLDPGTLLAGDRNALMVAIRVTGYGAEYEGDIECSDSECKKVTTRMFNLADLEIKRLHLAPMSPNENMFQFVLPKSKRTVVFKFMTGEIEEEINIVQERQKKVLQTQKDTHVTTHLLYSIMSVDGVSDRAKIARMVATMPASDSQALRKFIRENEPGITMKQESECKVCGHREEVIIPMGASFFWPQTK